MGQDDLVFGKPFHHGVYLGQGIGRFARVLMAYRFIGVNHDRAAMPAAQRHDRLEPFAAAFVDSRGVKGQLPDSRQPGTQAPFHLPGG
jgi:hypothetical protein